MKKFLFIFILSLVTFVGVDAQKTYVKFTDNTTLFRFPNMAGSDCFEVPNEMMNDSVITIYNAKKLLSSYKSRYKYSISYDEYAETNVDEYSVVNNSLVLYSKAYDINKQDTSNLPLFNDTTVTKHDMYCKVLCIAKGWHPKKGVTVVLDYGQFITYKRPKNPEDFKRYTIIGNDGKPKVFNTVIGALNYMAENGWEFVTAYTLSHGRSLVYHYLFKKTIHKN